MPTGVQISGLTFLSFINTDAKIPIQLTGTTYHIDYSAITDNIRVQGLNSSAPGNLSNAEGNGTIATGDLSHSEGEGTESIGASSHAEGDGSKSYGGNSHAEGALTIASGISSHSEGYQTKTLGDYSHSEGYGTVSEHNYQSVTGLFNTTGVTTSDDIFIIGNGVDTNNRSDLFIANLTGITINGVLTVTGSTNIRPYRVYTALLTQSGSNPPTENVLEDTLGHTGFTWSYSNQGVYFAESVGLFVPTNITFLVSGIGNNATGVANIYKYDNNQFTIETYDTSFSPANGILSNSMVEVRIYD